MKTLSAIFAVLSAVAGSQAALPQPDLIAQIHFAGAQKISASTNSAAFTNEFCSAEALALRAQTADKLSAWLSGWLQTKFGTTVPDGAAKLRPLFDDLQKSEWFLEARTAPDGKPAAAIAIQLAPARAQLWRENLKTFFPTGVLTSDGNWLILDANPALLKLEDRLVKEISAPPAGWLDLDVSWPRLAQWYPVLKSFGLPETQFTVTAPDDNFRINGKFFFPENLALNLEPWRVPTNTVHQPFVSFTAVRGFAAWFQSQAWAQPFQLTPVPNQLFTWALPQIPYQTFAAIPVPDATNALTQSYARCQPEFAAANARNYFMSQITLDLTNRQIGFHGVPFIAPAMRAVTEPAGQFLLAEAFPNTPRSKALPPELFERLGTKNLVFYHWEITSERLPQALNLSQLGLMLTQHRQLDGSAAALKWARKAAETLGNTGTEITQSGPAEFTFTRKAPGIFTAVEMLTLANWLGAANFPGCDLKLPPRPDRFKRLHPAPMPGALPTPAPVH